MCYIIVVVWQCDIGVGDVTRGWLLNRLGTTVFTSLSFAQIRMPDCIFHASLSGFNWSDISFAKSVFRLKASLPPCEILSFSM